MKKAVLAEHARWQVAGHSKTRLTAAARGAAASPTALAQERPSMEEAAEAEVVLSAAMFVPPLASRAPASPPAAALVHWPAHGYASSQGRSRVQATLLLRAPLLVEVRTMVRAAAMGRPAALEHGRALWNGDSLGRSIAQGILGQAP